MPQQIYINLPVNDLEASKSFFTKLGFEFDVRFTNENGACLVIGENIYAMLLTKPFFKTFTDKEIVDPKQSTEVLVCINRENRAAVDEIVERAKAAGGTVLREPQDHGFMYGRSFEDLDGHNWEVIHFDESQMPTE